MTSLQLMQAIQSARIAGFLIFAAALEKLLKEQMAREAVDRSTRPTMPNTTP